MARSNDTSGGSGRNQGNRGNQGSGSKQASGSSSSRSSSSRSPGSGDMSVREAGHKGGQRVSELVEKGKQRE